MFQLPVSVASSACFSSKKLFVINNLAAWMSPYAKTRGSSGNLGSGQQFDSPRAYHIYQ
jgi:hypothetical protein